MNPPPDPAAASVAVTPLEKLEAVREWVEEGIHQSLEADPSGFLLGCESVTILDALKDIEAALYKPFPMRCVSCGREAPLVMSGPCECGGSLYQGSVNLGG